MIESYKILKSLIKNLENFLAYTKLEKKTNATVLNNKDIVLDSIELTSSELLAEMTKQRIEKLFKEFANMQQIEELRKDEKHKYVGRNMLGVRKFDDWINNLEIGNIMHLNPITTNELL